MVKTAPILKDLLSASIIGVFIGYLAPFGMDRMPTHVSIFYWVVTCIAGYCVYKPILGAGEKILQPWIKSTWPKVAISTVFASAAMSFVVPVITWMFFRLRVDLIEQFWVVFPKAMVIGGAITIVSLVREVLREQKSQLAEVHKAHQELQDAVNADKNAGYEKLMTMLPLDKRGDLLCLQMDDHYLNVVTDKGQHLLLMRFKDAMELLQDFPGLQTHRSWWVAIDAVSSVKKEGRKHVLLLNNEIEVPVSKTYAERVKLAGLL